MRTTPPGRLKARAASGLEGIDDLLDEAAEESPMHQFATIAHVRIATAAPAAPAGLPSKGKTLCIDGGHPIMG